MRKHISIIIFLLGVVSISFGIDDTRLKDRLTGGVFELVVWENFDIKQLGATDDQLYRVLMEIYREADGKWKTLTPQTTEWGQNRNWVTGVFACLPLCGSISTKTFLLDYAGTKEKEIYTREAAICSYLHIADAAETKNILLQFLVEKDRMNSSSRLGIYSFARTTYDKFAVPEKKAAILAALLAAAQKEEGKIEFMKVDKILCERSPMYRQSQERLRLLEQHNQEPPTTNLYTDRDLKAALEEARSHAGYTTLGTNLAALALLDSPQPHQIVPNPVIAQKDRDKKSAKRRWIIIGVSLVTGLVAAIGFWLYRKKRAV